MLLKSSLEDLPEVAQVSYTSADQALQIFRDRHQSDYPTIQALDEIGNNPLGAYLNVKAKEVSQYESIESINIMFIRYCQIYVRIDDFVINIHCRG